MCRSAAVCLKAAVIRWDEKERGIKRRFGKIEQFKPVGALAVPQEWPPDRNLLHRKTSATISAMLYTDVGRRRVRYKALEIIVRSFLAV